MTSDGALVLAIDQGSQSTKVLLVDAEGRVHARSRSPLRPLETGAAGEAGRAEHPGDDLWESLVTAVRSLLASWDGRPDRIVALGLCSIRCCQVILDDAGRLLAPVRSWMDVRTWQPWAADRWHDDPRVATVGAASAYLTARLTGERVDAAAAYDTMWLDANQAPPGLLPARIDAGEVLGRLTPEAASVLGLPQGAPVVATGNDKAVEALGAGLVAEEDAVLLSLGTYVAAMTPVAVGGSRRAAAAAGEATWLNDACPPGTMLAETGGVRHGIGTVSWTAELMGDDVVALGREAAAVAAGADGVVAVPDWLAPGDQPWRRGALLGLQRGHSRAHVFRAVLEGLVLTMADNVRATEADLQHRFGVVVLSGGGAASPLLVDMVAAALDRPVVRPAETDAAGLGAAVCAVIGAGLHPGWEAAVAVMVRRSAPAAPAPDLVAAYADLAPRHGALREAAADLHRTATRVRRPE